MAALKYWLWLTSRKGMDAHSALMLLDHFLTPERAYYADRQEYDQLPLRRSIKEVLVNKELDSVDRILGDCDKLGLRIMTIQDGDYPQRLREIAKPPVVLYIRGKVFHFDEEVAIGMVGTRDPSEYGKKAANKFGFDLASGGALVVSGIAEGLDTFSIKGALQAGGSVVSVLAGGVDRYFPQENRYLYEDVAATGALISEYPPGTKHFGHQFPRRNRILSGLTLGVLAVECRTFGGTMSTMNHALDQDRDLFAVPGPIDAPMSEGTNRLIQRGAKLVGCGQDILDEYRSLFPRKLANRIQLDPETVRSRLADLYRQAETPDLAPDPVVPQPKQQKRPVIPRNEQKSRFTDDELELLSALKDKSRCVDELVELTQITARRVLSALTMLQVQSAVEEHPGKRFSALVELEE